jgi:hypothetical protein
MNDKVVVEDEQATFDVVVIQANLAISTANALSSWVNLAKPFWIDPIAYAFAASPAYLMSRQKVKRGEPETKLDFKRTFRDLAEAYGPPFNGLMRVRRALQPGDFDPASDADVVQTIINWQLGILSPPEQDTKFFDHEAQSVEPVLLTVPFFPLQLQVDPTEQPQWLELNLRLARAAGDQYPADRLVAGLLIEESLFDEQESLDFVIDQYLGVPADHIWLWLNDNEEIEMTVSRARRLKAMVQRLVTEGGKHVHQAFGGSFSSLMLGAGLTSVGHGVTYWEYKGWEPIAGGGVPTLRYFYPPLGQRLRFLTADAVVDSLIESSAEFHAQVCGCDVCIDALAGDLVNFARFGRVQVRERMDRRGHRIEYDVPEPEALLLNKRHYLQAKRREIDDVLNEGVDSVGGLERELTRHREGQQILDPSYLHAWLIALRS